MAVYKKYNIVWDDDFFINNGDKQLRNGQFFEVNLDLTVGLRKEMDYGLYIYSNQRFSFVREEKIAMVYNPKNDNYSYQVNNLSKSEIADHVKAGEYIETINTPKEIYPKNGRHGDFWYILQVPESEINHKYQKFEIYYITISKFNFSFINPMNVINVTKNGHFLKEETLVRNSIRNSIIQFQEDGRPLTGFEKDYEITNLMGVITNATGYSGGTTVDVTLYRTQKGQSLGNVIAKKGAYPTDGIQDGYWYVDLGKAMPTINIKQNNQLKQVANAQINGRNISNIYVKDQNGRIRNVK